MSITFRIALSILLDKTNNIEIKVCITGVALTVPYSILNIYSMIMTSKLDVQFNFYVVILIDRNIIIDFVRHMNKVNRKKRKVMAVP